MSCRIVLDNPGTYNPGDSVNGRVVCNFTSSLNFRGIRCKFRGIENTAWTERESYYNQESKTVEWKNVEYTGYNEFLAVNLNIVGPSILTAGHYEYPFTFIFPKHIPNTYKGNYGSIRYYIKANVDIPFGLDPEDEATLNLFCPINFNDILHELQMQPIKYQDEKTICCFWCASDPIVVTLLLEKQAFVVGEVAKIKVEINNTSNTDIEELKLSIEMTIKSKATSPNHKEKYDTELETILQPSAGVPAQDRKTYNIDFPIPQSTRLHNFDGCSLFKQWFTLKAVAVVPGWFRTNLNIQTEIKLGHVPITK